LGRPGEHGVGVIDVGFACDESGADGHEAVAFGHLDDDEFGFAEGEPFAFEDVDGCVGVVADEPDDGAIDGVDDRHCDDFDG